MLFGRGIDIEVEVIRESSEETVSQIMEIGKATYPISSNGDERSVYCEDLDNEHYINVVLKRERRIVGYLLACPHNEACVYLGRWDPFIAPDDGMYYVDTVQTLPGERSSFGFLILLDKLFDELRWKGIYRISAHLRQSNGFSRKITKMFPAARCLRTMENFMDTGEAFDYMETAIPT